MACALTTRLDAMPQDDLRRERAYWYRIERDDTWSTAGRAVARDFRIGCDAVLARRFPEGSLPPRDAAAPDTPDFPEPNGKLGPSVSLSHCVPVLEADPVIETK